MNLFSSVFDTLGKCIIISIFNPMKRVILVGFMGAGKTTLGKKIARNMHIPFVDSDREIELRFQKSIGDIFTEHGESYFRSLETEFIESMMGQEDFVLATGGGMPCFARNMERLNELGTTFYMERAPKELAHRLFNAKKRRPLIEGLEEQELLRFIEDRLSAREEYYRKATVILAREDQRAESVQKLMDALTTE
jgi:shikimate kinase